jgi:DNA anti-recombination protein RmuC
MRPDNTAPIIAAARRRHELTRSKAIQTLRELQRTGAPVSFAAIADTAGVSRSWLYAQDDLRQEITRLRDANRRAPNPPIPTTQRASDTSLRQRLEAAHHQIRQLREERDKLRHQLARVLGDHRHTGRGGHQPPS